MIVFKCTFDVVTHITFPEYFHIVINDTDVNMRLIVRRIEMTARS